MALFHVTFRFIFLLHRHIFDDPSCAFPWHDVYLTVSYIHLLNIVFSFTVKTEDAFIYFAFSNSSLLYPKSSNDNKTNFFFFDHLIYTHKFSSVRLTVISDDWMHVTKASFRIVYSIIFRLEFAAVTSLHVQLLDQSVKDRLSCCK